MAKSRENRSVNTPDPAADAPSARSDDHGHFPADELGDTSPRLAEQVRETGEEITTTEHAHGVVPPRPFIGRSHGVISASRDDLLAPVGADWEVDADL